MHLTKPTLFNGAVVVSGGSLGTYGIIKAATSYRDWWDNEEIDFLISKTSFSIGQANDKNTFGYAYGKFMSDTDGNRDFWKKQEDNMKEKEFLSNDFKNLNNDPGKLKSKCEDIYKKPKNEVNGNLESDTWLYCSFVFLKPQTVSSDSNSEYSNKWAGTSNNKNNLISVDNMTKSTWIHIFKLLKKDLQNTSKLEKIHEKLKKAKNDDDLLNFCKETYKSEATTTSSIYGENAITYCALDASITLEKYPTEPTQ